MNDKRNNTTSTTSSASTKFKIEQRVPMGAVKKGPYAVERSVDPNEVVIKRRFGEGSKPLFQRDDIAINRGSVGTASIHQNKNNTNEENIGGTSSSKPNAKNVDRRARHSTTDSSSPERYRPRDSYASHSSNIQLPTIKRSSANATTVKRPSPPPIVKRRTPEKVPYFSDEKREKERLRRMYGSRGDCDIRTEPKQRRRRSNSRSYSPPSSSSKLKRTTSASTYAHAHRRRSSSRSRFKEDLYKHHSSSAVAHRHRSSSVEDQRRRTQRSSAYHHSSRSQQHVTASSSTTHKHRRRGSRSLSRSRSPRRLRNSRSRERTSGSGGGVNNRNFDQHGAPPPPATQIITIPVPMADYPYAFPTWHPPHGWGPIGAAPLPRFAPYPHAHHMAPMMPAGSMLRPQLPYGQPPLPRMYRPRYPPQHNQRGFYRPRNN